MGIPPHGRHGQYPPHLHGMATSGGWDQHAPPWVHLASVPYPLRRKPWQWSLLTQRRQPGKPQEIARVVEAGYTRSREGVVTNVHKGEVPSRAQRLAPDLATYVVSPPIASRWIARDDGQRVTEQYRSHKRARVERATVEVSPCLGRLGQQGFPKGFHRVRSDGVPTTTTFTTSKGVRQKALAQVKGIMQGAM